MKRFFPLLALLLLIPALLLGCAPQPEPSPSPLATPAPTPTPGPVSYTTGLPGNDAYLPVIVSIDNVLAARPQSGIQDADIVYEVEAEGRIPRLIAVFNDKLPEKVGPVRSARVYFLDIVKEYDGLFVHIGGPQGRNNASNVYVKFRSLGIKHIDADREYTWRDYSRKAPHNCYTDVGKDREVYDYEPAPHAFLYSEKGLGEDAVSGLKLTVPYNGAENKTIYTYDEELGAYLRSNGTRPFIDANTGEQVQVKNVVLQFANHSMIDEKHINIGLIGSGEAWILSGGKCVKGTWERESAASATVFFDADGKKVPLQPGNTWINVARPNLGVTVE